MLAPWIVQLPKETGTAPPPVVVAVVVVAPPSAPMVSARTPGDLIVQASLISPPVVPPLPSGGVPSRAARGEAGQLYATGRALVGVVRLQLSTFHVEAIGIVSGGLRAAIVAPASVRGAVTLHGLPLTIRALGHPRRQVRGIVKMRVGRDEDDRLALDLLGWSDRDGE